MTEAVGKEKACRIRDSGMPPEAVWEGFFDAGICLKKLGVRSHLNTVVDFGCGYGTFSLAAAKVVGEVIALDMDSDLLLRLEQRAKEQGLSNITTQERDFMARGSGLPADSVHGVFLFNILHTAKPGRLVCEAFRILRPGGTMMVMHWIHDDKTPRGPDLSIRPKPQQCVSWAADAGFYWEVQKIHSLPPWHYGLVFTKPEQAAEP